MGIYNRFFDAEKWKECNKQSIALLEDYKMELLSQKKSKGTIDQYYNDLRIIILYAHDFCNNKSLLDLSKRDCRNFIIYCSQELKMSNARVNRISSALRTILSFAEDDEEEYEEYDRNVAAKIKGLPKEEVREIVFIEDEVIKQLYDKFIEEEKYRDATLLAILYDSGCRKNEIAQVKREDIKDNKNATSVVVGKRSKKFKVLYFSRTKEAFKLYNATRQDDLNSLFVTAQGMPADADNIYEWVKNWGKILVNMTGDAKYAGVNVHSFRHSYINNLLNGTHYLCKELKLGAVPLEKVKTLAHHENSDTTLHYAQDNSERDIEELFGITIE